METSDASHGYYWDRAKAFLNRPGPITVHDIYNALCTVANQIRQQDARLAREAGCADPSCHAPDHRLAVEIANRISKYDIPDVARCSDCDAEVGACECN